MKYSLTLILVLLLGYFSAQKINLSIEGISNKTNQIKSSSYLNSKEIINEKWLSLIEDGFLSASIDSIIIKDSITHIAYLFKGQKFNYASINTNIPDEFKSQMGISKKLFKNQQFSPIKLKTIISKILNYCSNNGHPFAVINLKIDEIKSGNINLLLNLKVGPRITVDKIILTKGISNQIELIKQIIDININDEFN